MHVFYKDIFTELSLHVHVFIRRERNYCPWAKFFVFFVGYVMLFKYFKIIGKTACVCVCMYIFQKPVNLAESYDTCFG